MSALIQFAQTDRVQRILQNIRTLLSTIEGSVPLDESFGISPDAIDQPLPVAQMKISSDIAVKLQIYEPRAIIKEIKFTANHDGEMVPSVTVQISDSEYTVPGGAA